MLADFLQKGMKLKGAQDLERPVIILAFDEAHSLMKSPGSWSDLSAMRHVLRTLKMFPLFSFFLSTTGKISQFTSQEDPSARISHYSLKLVHPFTELGFDMLATKVFLDGSWDLEHVTSDQHMVTWLSRVAPCKSS